MVQVQQRQVRTESAARWEKALARALANRLEVFQVADTGERMVTSASQLDTLHRTDGRTCTCAAALAGDAVCQHRAVVRFVIGWLPEPSPRDAGPCASCHHPDTSLLLVQWQRAHPERLRPAVRRL